jgi:hypothetical protein
MPRKGWKKEKALQEEELKNQALNADETIESITTIKKNNVEEKPIRKSKKKQLNEVSLQNMSRADKNKLPKVILCYYDKNDRLVNKEYICYELNIYENLQTKISGIPNSRKDLLDFSLDAKVVEIN